MPPMRRLGSAAAIALLAIGATLAPATDTPLEVRARPAPAATTAPAAAAAFAAPSLTVPSSLQMTADGPQMAAGSPQTTAGSPQTAEAPPVMATPTAAPGGPIPEGFRIQIPRLGIDLTIQEGDLKRDIEDQRTPEGYAFHLPGTAIPGQNGNTFLYAHARRQMFLALWNARPGDAVIVQVPDGGTLEYVVRDVLPRVAPSDLSATRSSSTEQLTLQTSTGPSPGDPRFIVVAFPP